ncbi:poly(A) RNA polymerase GLD2 [Kryptolebias marmoratus]|uniref:polynucleotide adenylyltransferase n=1 Tax=Kryptolebias marmoratus TaxID=37003 RepID=A0A3Q3AK62_KRYMA|nr:poly(A) RNA polymerase GLD2 [Kryptolebias marmoratus]XP_017269124.1 poly(A) RNA polymerase GLD2 [Kryptolebias marmoratus]XP_017269125.1 poly(A) RNA polymerase GLD2 [Kryptolebias marmoratus]XP_017269126.1 poly(A) RNA polymerase GLD2 [Kryptolebias marmoratus]
MFQRDATPRRRPAFNNPYLSAQVLPYYNYNHRCLEGANSYHVRDKERLPPYVWKPKPPTSTVVPPQTPIITNGRKRQNNDYSTHAVKRQRLDSSPHPSLASTYIRTTQPPHYPNPAESSRSSLVGPDHFFPGPPSYPHPQVVSVPESSNSLQLYAKDKLSSQMVELFEACQQQSSDLERKEVLRSQLQQEILQFYAVARLYLTGSSMNGLGCRSSDADLCLVITANKRPDPISVLSRLKRAFGSLSYIERIQLIRAKVPILRFRKKGSDLEFDLNINNTVGIRNTFLLRSYAHADVRVRPLILVIKKWARHHQINDASKGTLSSYTLVLMVLHFLQTLKEPVLPSLQRDYPDCFNPFMNIDMVPEGPKHVPPYISRNQSSLGELLLGFLRYYATQFSWDKQVISVREAATFPRTNSHEWKNKFICVEEPFERNNVARAVHEKLKFEIIKAQFAESCRILHARKDLNSILPVRTVIAKELSRR